MTEKQEQRKQKLKSTRFSLSFRHKGMIICFVLFCWELLEVDLKPYASYTFPWNDDGDTAAGNNKNMMKRLEEDIPIMELLHPSNLTDNKKCPPGLIYVEDRHLPRSITHLPGRKIPNIIHMTSKSRCMTKAFADNINTWKAIFPRYSVYLHDDEAIQRLFTAYPWKRHFGSNFDSSSILCISSGAALADVYRYLLLYEYGGIYTDIDTSPNTDNHAIYGNYTNTAKKNATTTPDKYTNIDKNNASTTPGNYTNTDKNSTTITPDSYTNTDKNSTTTTPLLIRDTDDSLFVIEQLGVPSQYFMVSSKYHPVIKFTLMYAIRALFDLDNVMNDNAAYTTGPRALKNGFVIFMNSWYHRNHRPLLHKNKTINDAGWAFQPHKQQQEQRQNYWGYEGEGIYLGYNNRSVTLLGHKKKSNEYILRYGVRTKANSYQAMNMSHFSTAKNFVAVNVSDNNSPINCEKHIQNIRNVVTNEINHKMRTRSSNDDNKDSLTFNTNASLLELSSLLLNTTKAKNMYTIINSKGFNWTGHKKVIPKTTGLDYIALSIFSDVTSNSSSTPSSSPSNSSSTPSTST